MDWPPRDTMNFTLVLPVGIGSRKRSNGQAAAISCSQCHGGSGRVMAEYGGRAAVPVVATPDGSPSPLLSPRRIFSLAGRDQHYRPPGAHAQLVLEPVGHCASAIRAVPQRDYFALRCRCALGGQATFTADWDPAAFTAVG